MKGISGRHYAYLFCGLYVIPSLLLWQVKIILLHAHPCGGWGGGVGNIHSGRVSLSRISPCRIPCSLGLIWLVLFFLDQSGPVMADEW